MNHIALIGRLGAAPEIKTTPSGVSVMSFSLAVTRPKVKDTTDWINCVAWRHNAEFLAKYAGKGSRIGVTGALTQRKWEKDGSTMVTYEVNCDNVEILDSRANSPANDNKPTERFKTDENGVFEGVEILEDDGDLPF